MILLSFTWYDEACVFIIGLILGSFSTALASRNITNTSWMFDSGGSFARSKCVHCDVVLRAADLIPVISWIIVRGRCGNCHNAIGFVYLFTEVVSAIISLVVYFLLGLNWLLLVVLCVQPFLLAQCVKPLYHQQRNA